MRNTGSKTRAGKDSPVKTKAGKNEPESKKDKGKGKGKAKSEPTKEDKPASAYFNPPYNSRTRKGREQLKEYMKEVAEDTSSIKRERVKKKDLEVKEEDTSKGESDQEEGEEV